MKPFVFYILILFISATRLIGAGTHSIVSWGFDEFGYSINSEAKTLNIVMRRPVRKMRTGKTYYFPWSASLRTFTRPDIKGVATINERMKNLNWAKVRKSAEAGNPYAAYLFAHNLLLNHRYGEAAYFLKLSYLKGHSAAMNDCGILSLFGLGTPRNISKAYEMFSESANKGCPMGQLNVGLCNMLGLGCRKNLLSAKSNIQGSADKKNPVAEAILAINYAIGTPLANLDPKKAYKLTLLARAHGLGRWGLDKSSSYYFVDLSKLEKYIEYQLTDSEIEYIQKTIPSDTGLNNPNRESYNSIIDSYKPKPEIVIIGPKTNAVINSFSDIPFMGNKTPIKPKP